MRWLHLYIECIVERIFFMWILLFIAIATCSNFISTNLVVLKLNAFVLVLHIYININIIFFSSLLLIAKSVIVLSLQWITCDRIGFSSFALWTIMLSMPFQSAPYFILFQLGRCITVFFTPVLSMHKYVCVCLCVNIWLVGECVYIYCLPIFEFMNTKSSTRHKY